MTKPPKNENSGSSVAERARNRHRGKEDPANKRANAPRPQLRDGAALRAGKKQRNKKPDLRVKVTGASEVDLQSGIHEGEKLEGEKLEGEKLQKVLARSGLGSRRDMEKFIAEGRITVNGEVAKLGDRIGEDDKVLVNGSPIELRAASDRQARVLIYNKPEGEICSARDPEGRPTVFDRLPRLRGERWIAVGRLDFNTSGLLLFTTDGELANALMHPSSNIDREYLCRVMGEVTEEKLAHLREGVMLDDGMARFNDITEGGGSETSINRWYYVCLMEG